MAFVFRGYVRLLQRWTLPTQMATASVCAATGDLIHQLALQDKRFDQVEWYSTARLLAYGGFVFAPLSNTWHRVLNRINLESRVKTVLARTATDLMFFSPFATCLFYTTQGMFERRPLYTPDVPSAPQGIYERIEERLWPTVQKQWAVFGPANLVNLSVVPLYARPPFMNVISIGWNTFLASAQHRGGISPDETLSRDMQLAIAAAETME